MNTIKFPVNAAVALLFLTALIGFSGTLVAEQLKGVDDLKPSHRPALNYPQAVAWLNTRSVDSGYALRASDVIGRSVYNGVGKELGEVDDLVVLNKDGQQVMQVIVEAGGFLGLGERLVAIPFAEFKIDPDNDDLVYFNITQAQLKSLPEFKYRSGEEMGKAIFGKSRANRKPAS